MRAAAGCRPSCCTPKACGARWPRCRASRLRGLANYGNPYGYLPLRQQIQVLLAQKGIEAPPHQIVLTHGASQALILAARCLLQPHDVVLVDRAQLDQPVRHAALARPEARGHRAHRAGPRPRGPAHAAQRHQAKAFFTTANLHNPHRQPVQPSRRLPAAAAGGATGLPHRRQRHDVRAGAAGRNLAGEPRPPAARDPHRQLLQDGVAQPARGLRRVQRGGFAEKLILHKMVNSLTTSELNEKLMHGVLAEGVFRAHLTRLAEQLRAAQEKV